MTLAWNNTNGCRTSGQVLCPHHAPSRLELFGPLLFPLPSVSPNPTMRKREPPKIISFGIIFICSIAMASISFFGVLCALVAAVFLGIRSIVIYIIATVLGVGQWLWLINLQRSYGTGRENPGSNTPTTSGTTSDRYPSSPESGKGLWGRFCATLDKISMERAWWNPEFEALLTEGLWDSHVNGYGTPGFGRIGPIWPRLPGFPVPRAFASRPFSSPPPAPPPSLVSSTPSTFGDTWTPLTSGDEWMPSISGDNWSNWTASASGDAWTPPTSEDDWETATSVEDWAPSTSQENWEPLTFGHDWAQSTSQEDWAYWTYGYDWAPSMFGGDCAQSTSQEDWTPSTSQENWAPLTFGHDWEQSTSQEDWAHWTYGYDWAPPMFGGDWTQSTSQENWGPSTCQEDWAQSTSQEDWALFTPQDWAPSTSQKNWAPSASQEDWAHWTPPPACGEDWTRAQDGSKHGQDALTYEQHDPTPGIMMPESPDHSGEEGKLIPKRWRGKGVDRTVHPNYYNPYKPAHPAD